jgi:hypothetical protein
MRDFLKRVALDRVMGERPAPPRAIGASLAVGTAAAAVTYKLLRHEAK